MMHNAVARTIAACALILSIVGCSEKPKDTATIAAILSLTGPAAEAAGYVKDGIDMAIAEGQGGIRIVYGDSKNMPKDGLSVYEQLLLTEKPDAVISMLSSVTKALVEKSKTDKKVLIATAVGLPKVAEPSPYAFRLYPTGEGLAGIMARYAVRQHKTAAVAYLNDDFGISGAQFFKTVFEENGGRVLDMEPFALAERDFRQQWAKISINKPACVWIIGYGPAYVTLIKQFRDSGSAATLFCDMTMGIPSTRNALGTAAEGVIYVDAKVDAEFTARYIARYKRPPTSYSGYGYDMINLLRNAMPKDLSSDTLRHNLVALRSFTGVMGPISFDASRDGSVRFVLMQVRSGEPVTLE